MNAPEVVAVEVRGVRITLELTAPAFPEGEPAEVAAARSLGILLFDLLEQRVLRLLCASPQLAKSELSEKLRVAADGQLKDQLTRLVRCKVLTSSSNGYSLACPPGVVWQDRARAVLNYLDSLPLPEVEEPASPVAMHSRFNGHVNGKAVPHE